MRSRRRGWRSGTPFGRFVRHLLERLLDRWSEGPGTPSRLLEQADDFHALYPGATREEWATFATRAIDGAYRAGFVAGFETDVRTGFGRRHPSPEFLADLEEPGWRNSPEFKG